MKLKLLIFIGLFSYNLSSQQIEDGFFESEEFTINYPGDWTLQNAKNANTNFAVLSPLESKEDTFSENLNIISEDFQGKTISLQEYTNLSIKQILTLPQSKIIERVTLSREGQNYYQVVFEVFLSNQLLKMKQFYFVAGSKAYVLTFSATKSAYADYVKYADRMLKSFKIKNP